MDLETYLRELGLHPTIIARIVTANPGYAVEDAKHDSAICQAKRCIASPNGLLAECLIRRIRPRPECRGAPRREPQAGGFAQLSAASQVRG